MKAEEGNARTTMSHFLKAIQELRSVNVSDYDERIEDICRDLDDETMQQGSWPTGFFPELMSLLSDDNFLAVRTSWNLLRFIKNNWDLVSPNDAAVFREKLVAAFDRFGDWMGPFVASEILGEFYPDAKTLRMLSALSRTAGTPARELVPHALETLGRTTQDEVLRGLVVRELEVLVKDDSEAVRKEAATALKRVACAN